MKETALNLLEVMKKEIEIMREILTLMLQEEQALVSGNESIHKELVLKRLELRKKLLPLKRKRAGILKSIDSLSFNLDGEKASQDPFLMGIFSEEEDEVCELISLREQILLLSKKILSQQLQNRRLLKNMKNGILPYKPMEKKAPSPSKQKPHITTMEVEGESEKGYK